MKKLNQIWVPKSKFERYTSIVLVLLITSLIFTVSNENESIATLLGFIDVLFVIYALTQGSDELKEQDRSRRIEKNKKNTIDNEIIVVGTFAYKNDIESMYQDTAHNPYYLYNIDGKEIENLQRLNVRNYKYLIYNSFAILENEPSNEHDKNAIKVIVNGYCVGYIPKEYQQFIRDNNISHADVSISGGDYNVWSKVKNDYKVSNVYNDFGVTLKIN